MIRYNNKVEVLAPAGSYDIMEAVINAGADAVYLGGSCFGARAFAGNLSKEELLKAIDFAHIRDRKIYLTVNTLLKERELDKQLVEYLTPFYEAGLDAVIVQDIGVFKTIRQHFPDMAVHASTQMTITGVESAKILEKLGASRVVTARELNLNELKAIHDNTNIEIESFVHGALCYCYSGQCLLSSMNGGRSGNRGRCAQPCRMEYDVYNCDGKAVSVGSGKYVLSPKDMCAIDILPDIIDAGVYSLKIEGRMKNVTYAAAVTAFYRKYVDMYLKYGRKGYKVDKNDINDLMDLYNRGAFTSGYYNSEKGADMMSLSRPNHMGTKALQVISNVSGKVKFKALEKINPQDVFEIDADNSFSSGAVYECGQTFEVNLPKRLKLDKGRVLFRTRNGKIVKETQEKYTKTPVKKKLDIAFYAHANEKANIMLTDNATGIVTYTEGEVVDLALKQPIAKDKVINSLKKTGDTPFEAGSVIVELSDNAFIPMGQLNELRRKAFSNMEKVITDSYRRVYKPCDNINNVENENTLATKNDIDIHTQSANIDRQAISYKKSVLISYIEQIDDIIYENDSISDIYYSFELFDDKRIVYELEKCHKHKKRAILALPHITTQKTSAKVKKLIEMAVSGDFGESVKIAGVDGVMVRSLEQLGIFSSVASQAGYSFTKNVITDANLYIWNNSSFEQFIDIVKECGLELIKVTLPFELTAKELADITIKNRIDVELVVYTRIPVMISEQCVRKTKGLCDHSNNYVYIQDKKSRDFLVRSVCSYCYSIMYASSKLNISAMDSEIALVNADYLRYELVDRKEKFDNIYIHSDMENGHFVMGVE